MKPFWRNASQIAIKINTSSLKKNAFKISSAESQPFLSRPQRILSDSPRISLDIIFTVVYQTDRKKQPPQPGCGAITVDMRFSFKT